MSSILDVNVTDFYFILSMASISFNPLFWNIVARNEYHNKTLTSVFGSPKIGCYFLAGTIFSLGLIRDYIYKLCLENQPITPALNNSYVQVIGVGLILFGQVLVLSSTYRLGITGTFLGDYFGILMSSRVTGFPFSFVDNPMYLGSTFIFLGTGLWYGRLAGILLTLHVYLVYRIAESFENPFTTMIYEQKGKLKNKKN